MKQLIEKIQNLIQTYYANQTVNKFEYGMTKIDLAAPSFGIEEIMEAIDSLISTNLTIGKKVELFEMLHKSYLGSKYNYMVSSGSAANLLALSCLTNPRLKNYLQPDSEIITPAITFATTIFPIIQTNCVPVLVDVDLDTLGINIDAIEAAITPKTRAIMPVHLLGCVCDIEKIMKLAKKYNLYVIEDTCDSSGSEVNGKKSGSFGDIGTFSFAFPHVMTTMEGGMLSTNNEELSELINTLRIYGWTRTLKDKDEIANQYPEIDPKFLFYNIGYNFKPTELQGAFGIHQIKKLDNIVEARRINAIFYANYLKKYREFFYIVEEKENNKNSWYGYPIIIKDNTIFTRKELTDFLNFKKVETRPILSGNFAKQPALSLFKNKVYNIPNSEIIHNNGFFMGVHQKISNVERKAVTFYIEEFMRSKGII